MNAASPRVLITGANGFVGARLCRAFLAAGFEVAAAVRRTSDLSLLQGLKLEYRYGDVAEPSTLRDVARGVDYVIHNAGLTRARRPEQFYQVNEHGCRAMLEAIVADNPAVKKVVLVSSLAAIGPATNGHPLCEEDPPHPISEYGRSKLAGEQAAVALADRINVCIVRPPAVYGPGDRDIYSFFRAVRCGIRPYLGDMRRQIHLVHVDDLCRGILAAATADTKSGEAFFIAENRSYSMKELITVLHQVCGRRGLILPVPAGLVRAIAAVSETLCRNPVLTRDKAGELLAGWEVSTQKARRQLGFESSLPFEMGARETYTWYRKQGWL